MTEQEMFDKVVEMLAARNFTRAGRENEVTGNFSCRYRSDVGPCAIGLFITDEEYDESMEGKIAPLVVTQYSIKALEDVPRGFINRLQAAHDDGFSPDRMINNLKAFALSHSLTFPEVLND